MSMKRERKPRTKKIPFDNVATEVKGLLDSEVWEFEVKGRRWRWMDHLGINVSLFYDGGFRPLVYVAKLEQAAMFAEGFDAGYATAVKEAKDAADKQTGGASDSDIDLQRTAITED